MTCYNSELPIGPPGPTGPQGPPGESSLILTGSYTPTITDIISGSTVTLSDVRYMLINDIAEIKGTIRVDLDGASSSEGFDIDLDPLIEPATNFVDQTNVIGGIVPTTGFTSNIGGSVIAVVTAKKIQFLISNDNLGGTLKVYFSATYNV